MIHSGQTRHPKDDLGIVTGVDLCDVVELAVDLPEEDLPAGTVGTIVHIFDKPNRAYEVEFADGNGKTIATAALTDDQIRYAGT